MSGPPPEVSICLITYNHEPYIRQAIEGVLAQEKPFSWELIIAEDFSTDGTRQIVEEYGKADPAHIRLILPPANTRAMVWVELMAAARGRWVAYLDGDDYWTDPRKLLEQTAVLENRPEVAIVAHRMRVLDESTGRYLADHRPRGVRATYDLDDLTAMGPFFCNSSVLYRGEFLRRERVDAAVTRIGDWMLHLQVARHGSIAYLDEAMGVYRLLAGSRSAMNRRDIDGALADVEYTLERARTYGASPDALRRGAARIHFLASLAALEQGDIARFRCEAAATGAEGVRLSPMQQLVYHLRGAPRVARGIVQAYTKLARYR